MPSVNMAIIMGHVGKDPEYKTLPSGNVVSMFSVATVRGRKVEDKWEDQTTWHRIINWNPSEYLINNVKKGTLVFIQGRVENREYKTAEGGVGYVSEIVADKVSPIVAKNKPGTPTQRETLPKLKTQTGYVRPDDDIPF